MHRRPGQIFVYRNRHAIHTGFAGLRQAHRHDEYGQRDVLQGAALPLEKTQRGAVPAHNHRAAHHHAVVALEIFDLIQRQDIHLRPAAGNLLAHRLGDFAGRTGHRDIGNKDSSH